MCLENCAYGLEWAPTPSCEDAIAGFYACWVELPCEGFSSTGCSEEDELAQQACEQLDCVGNSDSDGASACTFSFTCPVKTYAMTCEGDTCVCL